MCVFVHVYSSSGEDGSPIKVGFVTYDRVIQFYNVKGNMVQPQMMVMADVDDVFVPMTDGFLVSVEESKTVLERCVAGITEALLLLPSSFPFSSSIILTLIFII